MSSRRLLTSSLVDVLLGPHGVDRYLELIRPVLTVRDPRAEVLAVRHQTDRSVTVTLRPNSAWAGFRAGQFVRVGVEIDGVRHTRTYSPAGSEHRKRELELTAAVHPKGLVSRHLKSRLRPGDVVYLGEAQGDFCLPHPRPDKVVLVSGGSGITPVLAMLRSLCDEDHSGQIVFIHYARTADEWLYASEAQALARRHPNLRVHYVATREGGQRVTDRGMRELVGDHLSHGHAAVCGPPGLIGAVTDVWSAYRNGRARVISETFTPPRRALSDQPGTATLHFTRSGRTVAGKSGTLLEQAEAAGLSPAFGCRMGICHTCTCRKTAGAVRNLLSGEVTEGEDEDIRLCISAPAGDVALEL